MVVAEREGQAAKSSTKADHQRERILRAAVKLFTTRGYHATSLKQLASKAGMTAPNLYHYYRGKEEILFEVYYSQLAQVLEDLTHLAETEDDPAARIRAAAYGMVSRDLHDPLAGFVPTNGVQGLRGANAKVIRELMRSIRTEWTATIAAGVEQGVFHVTEPKLAALNALTMCSHVANWFDPKGTYSQEEVADEVARSCLRILGYNGAEGAPSATATVDPGV